MGLSRPGVAAPVAASAVLASCSGASSLPQLRGGPITIGVPLALTGSLAAEGGMAEEGYYFCRDWINAKGGLHVRGVWHPLVLSLQDDQSRVSVSAQITERLISQDHVPLLLGPVGNALADADAAIAHVPIVLTSSGEATFNRQYQYVFGVASPACHYLQGVVDMALTLKPRPQSAAILLAHDTFSTEVANDIHAYADGKGISVVIFDSYSPGTNDLRSKLGGIASAAPDLVLEIGHPSETVVTMQQARQLNVHPRLFAFTSGPETPGFLSDLKKTAEYVYGSPQWAPGARFPVSYFLDGRAYAAQYLSAYGHLPNASSAAATAACLSLEVTVERAGSTDPAAVGTALSNLDLQTFFGQIRFDSRGLDVSRPMTVVQVQDGSAVVVWPPAVAMAQPRYPMPNWDGR